jgi:hypothetical protein
MTEQQNTTQQIIPPCERSISIKGLIPALPERGKIKAGRKGVMKTSQNGKDFQPPQKLNHFIVTTLERGEDGNFLRDEAIHAILGDEPKSIPVRLLYDDISLNFPTRYACYAGRNLFCAGDGETAMRLINHKEPKDGKKQVPCTCERLEQGYTGSGRCKPNGVLSVIIDGVSGLGGVWKFRSTSWNSITSILSQMSYLRSITGGILANIPLRFEIYPKQVEVEGKQTTVYVTGLTYAGNIEDLQQVSHQIALGRAQHRISMQQIEDEARRLLPAPSDVLLPGDEGDDVVDEFYPEQASGKPVVTPPQRHRVTAADLTGASAPTVETLDHETGEVTKTVVERTATEDGDGAPTHDDEASFEDEEI